MNLVRHKQTHQLSKFCFKCILVEPRLEYFNITILKSNLLFIIFWKMCTSCDNLWGI